MRNAKLGLLIALVGLMTACNAVPPTVVMMVVTATPDARVVPVTVTPTGNVPQAQTAPATIGGAVTNAETPSPSPVVPPATSTVPAATLTFGPTQTLSPFPTETRAQLYIAQQDFEHGFMFWISTKRIIWVLISSPGNPRNGEWRSYDDTFVDGEPEIDPTLTPPSPDRYQPKRGFGKLWRTTPGLRDALGWGTTPEFALTTTYVYQPGGYLDSNNKYVAQPGKHFLTSLSRQVFALSEGDHTWERVD